MLTQSEVDAARRRAAGILDAAGTVLSPAERERIEVEPANSYRLELENVSEAAGGRAELLLGRDDAMGQARALEALHRSAQTGAPVSL